MKVALYLSVALLYGVYLGINQIVDLHGRFDVAPWKPMVWELSSVVVIFALIPLVVRFERIIRIDSKPRWRVVVCHLGAAMLFSAVHVAGFLALRQAAYAIAGQRYDFGDLPVRALYELQKDLVTYVIVLVAIFAYREFQVRRTGELRAAELSAELSRAQLKHLTTQIEPHFLFNSLNAISNRMHEDVDAADRMISDLGGLLRAAYDTDNHLLIPLRQEVAWLQNYGAMMSERFRGKLTFELAVTAGSETVAVPRLLLQPIVENAFTHGLAGGPGRVSVDIERYGRQLRYRIADDGSGLRDLTPNPGTGLSNVARRLELLFPGDHVFSLQPNAPRGTLVTVCFPVSE